MGGYRIYLHLIYFVLWLYGAQSYGYQSLVAFTDFDKNNKFP